MKKKFGTLIIGFTFMMTTSNVFGMIQGVVSSGGAVAYNHELKQIHSLDQDEVLTLDKVEGNSDIYSIQGLEDEYFVNADYIELQSVNLDLSMSGVKVRAKAHQNGTLLDTLDEGEQLKVVAQGDKWYEVELTTGKTGYVYKAQIESEVLEKLPYKNFKTVEVVHWSEARDIIPRGAVVTIEDVYTGKTFKVKRTFGTNHADVEALTNEDTAMIKRIWGGFTWERRPVIVHTNGRMLAASLAGMPHAGNSLDAVKGNGMSGVIDLHFKGSKKHADGTITATEDPLHQKAIQIAAKYQK